VLTTGEMRALPPSAFSWNVAARVLAQDTALPVAAQICGPSEFRYCGRLAKAHAALGVPAPLLARRSQWWFVTPRSARLARDLGVSTAVVAEPGTKRPMPARPRIEPREVKALRDAAAKLSAGGSAAVQRRRAALLHDVDAYAEALRRDEDERTAVATSRRTRLDAMLRPDGGPQDRVFSPLPWLAQIEWSEIERLISSSADFRRRRVAGTGRLFEFGVGAAAGTDASAGEKDR